ncbi:MAG: cbb3-type cytochrome c oxidase subunit I [Gammaproteobacteria bacterium]|nr:cbb3-type cytochrome c oxidase subunit I [Gammaproteobacteria bacterium]MDH5802471.1 cbb3-type cytochrome c oxidase subunit I [Gammaproteobacteria bacterium]
MSTGENRHLVKFIITSATCFFIGTVHGVLQVIRPIRAWLDSIGSPYGGPGHMIDPLAHAHINVVGGVVIFIMGASYYLLPKMLNAPIYSRKLVSHTYWWTTLGITGFYSTLMIFGILEGQALLADPTGTEAAAIHQYYGRTIAIVATVMGMGFWIFFTNLFLTMKHNRA